MEDSLEQLLIGRPKVSRQSGKQKQQARSVKRKNAVEKVQPPPLLPLSVRPRSAGQRLWLQALQQHRLVVGEGPAGSGKTYLAVSHAVDLLLSGVVDRIYLTRPAVEAEEKIGFMPGDLKSKLDPYLRPLYDALYEKLGSTPTALRQIETWFKTGVLEIAPLAFLRGRTLRKAAVVGDEMQNATYNQLKMFVTRLGAGSHMMITGDVTQTDLPHGLSGFPLLLEKLERHAVYPVVRLRAMDVQRDPIVADLVTIL